VDRQCRRLPVRQQLHQAPLCQVLGNSQAETTAAPNPARAACCTTNRLSLSRRADRKGVRTPLRVMQQQAFAGR
jgi:hypothetical protein